MKCPSPILNRLTWRRSLALLAMFSFLGACGEERAGEQTPPPARVLPIGLEIPDYFPIPRVPEENRSSEEKIELGRWLFYDRKLSGNGEQRCADCHQQRYAFTDGRARAIGSTGAFHPRGSMSLANIAYAPTLGWADPTLTLLEDQALIPMFGEDPVELGLTSPGDQLLERLRADPAYQERFAAAFEGDSEPITLENILRALATFQRALISANSPFDRYLYQGDQSAISDAAKQGFELFMSERLECFHCHGGFNFSDAVHNESVFVELSFHNTGLYKLD
ncbi:MAG: cytochrome c peroxidase, partial [Myxococcota bacterium]|nr:cytochrome c peroxidase [Myxococcota bacterium]